MEPRGQVKAQESAADVGSVVEPSRVPGIGSQSQYGGTTTSGREVAVEAAAADRPGDAELTFAEMLAEFDAVGRTSRRHRAGDVITGRITSIGLESAFVHLGGKTEGVLDRAQITDSQGRLTVAVGTTVSARVVGEGHETGLIELALKVSEGPKAVEQLALAMSEGIAVEGRVSGINKGGFDVDVAGMRAFCPISQIDDRFVKDGQGYLGRTFDFAITQCEPGPRPNIVLSRRVLLDAERERLAEVTRGQLTVGAVVRGVVTAVQEFGVFVDLGGLEGLVHVSELSHVRVDDPKRFAEVGQQLDVVVLGIEASTDAKHARRVRLSCKALEQDPWAEAGFAAGQRGSGKVARIQSFGAFVEIAPGIEGLVHISEMGAGQRIKSPRDVVAEGQEVHVQILSIDPGRRRIALSIDAAQEQDREAEDRVNIASYQPGSGSLGTFADLLKK